MLFPQPFLNISLDQVTYLIITYLWFHISPHAQISIPGLHISLGIFYRLFGLLEDAVHNLDRIAAIDLDTSSSNCTASLAAYVQARELVSKLREERQTLVARAEVYDQVITMAEVNESSSLTINTSLITSMGQEVQKTRREIQAFFSNCTN